MTKEKVLERIADSLEEISESLAGIEDELDDLGLANKLQVILMIAEQSPEMKEKLKSVIEELAGALSIPDEDFLDEDDSDLKEK